MAVFRYVDVAPTFLRLFDKGCFEGDGVNFKNELKVSQQWVFSQRSDVLEPLLNATLLPLLFHLGALHFHTMCSAKMTKQPA